MISFIRGRLVEKSPSHAIIECNGLGYFLSISLNTYSKLPETEECKLLTHYSVSVDVRSGNSNHTLFGFADKDEKHVFLNLIEISGVSSNTARTILSTLQPDELISAVHNSEESSFKKVKGVGPKLASKIIAEMKGKLDNFGDGLLNVNIVGNTTKIEALSALTSLGFDKKKAELTIDGLLKNDPHLNVEILIKQALKTM